jgi:hypothetical protein
LRLDFGRNFLLYISSLEIQSRKFLQKSNINKINVVLVILKAAEM